jgi:signal peptidase I
MISLRRIVLARRTRKACIQTLVFNVPDQITRGDIIVFASPRDPKALLVKRMIGLPGERVQLKGGIGHINGSAVPTVAAGEAKV